MNVDTGAIAQFENAADAEAAGYALQLTKEQAKHLLSMTRRERREWANKSVRAKNLARLADD